VAQDSLLTNPEPSWDSKEKARVLNAPYKEVSNALWMRNDIPVLAFVSNRPDSITRCVVRVFVLERSHGDG
jgi:hypothetical protein